MGARKVRVCPECFDALCAEKYENPDTGIVLVALSIAFPTCVKASSSHLAPMTVVFPLKIPRSIKR